MLWKVKPLEKRKPQAFDTPEFPVCLMVCSNQHQLQLRPNFLLKACLVSTFSGISVSPEEQAQTELWGSCTAALWGTDPEFEPHAVSCCCVALWPAPNPDRAVMLGNADRGDELCRHSSWLAQLVLATSRIPLQ